MSGAVFGKLPPTPKHQRESKYRILTRELRARPGEWARLATSTAHPVQLVNSIRAGLGCWEPRGAYEAERRGHDVWARYVGGAA